MSVPSSDAETRLLALTNAISDGEPIDWNEEAGTSPGSKPSTLLSALQELDAVVRAHRSWRQTAPLDLDGQGRARDGRWLWGHLEVLESIGEGASARVYRAFDTHLEREVALKLFELPGAGADDARALALREGRLLARVRHPNVATVFGVDERDGTVGVWMELIGGQTLSDLLQASGPLSAREAAGIGVEVCRALASLHSVGLLHRDVKAQNVMRQEGGRIVLFDLGIGHDLNARTSEPNDLSGTPLYLAPELLAGERPSPQSDLYSVGVLLYHLVTASFPFEARSLDELQQLHAGRPPLLTDVRPDLPREFCSTVDRALSTPPQARFATAGEMELALSAALASGLTQQPPSGWKRLVRAGLRHRTQAAALALVLGLVGAAGWGVDRHQYREARRQLEAAEAQHDRGQVQAAIHSLESATETYSKDPEIWYQLGLWQRGIGRWLAALDAAERSAALRGRAPDELVPRIDYLLARLQGNIHRALDHLRTAARIDLSNDEAPRNAAMLESKLGNTRRAVGLAKQAVDRAPENVINWGVYGNMLVQHGTPEDALIVLEDVPEDLRKHPYLHWPRGMAALVQGDFETARRTFLALLRENETYRSNGRLFLSQVDFREGRFEKGLRRLERGFKDDGRGGLDRDRLIRSYWLAYTHAFLDHEDRALEALEVLDELEDTPQVLEFHRNAAVLQVRLGRAEEAERLRRRIAEVTEEYPFAANRAYLAQVEGEQLLAAGNLDEAARRLQAAERQFGDVSTRLSLARFRVRRGECPRAVPILDELRLQKGVIFQRHPVVLYQEALLDLASCRAEAGDQALALDALDELLREWKHKLPDHPLVQRASALEQSLQETNLAAR